MVKKKEKVDDEGQPLFNASHDGPQDEARAKALEAALTDLTKRFGDGTVVRLGDAVHMQVDVIPSGSLGVDICVGVGGIPRGRITEIYGPESSGKTTLCLHVIAEAQKRGGICAFVDMEHALDPAYAARIGVNTSTLYVAQPDTGENALEITESLVRSGALDVIVIDSVAALVPRAEIEGEMGDSHVGLQARLMSQALRKLSGAIKQSNVAVMFTNQIREKVGVMYGCFSNQAPVLLADGTSATIGEIVNQKKPVEVISWNEETGAFEPRRVINWFKNGVPVDEFALGDNEIGALEQEYVTLRSRYPRGGGYKDGAAVMATPNHLIATPDGFQHAGDIDLGDQVLNLFDDTLLSNDLEQLVIGSTLGDGSIRYVSDQSAYFREEHAAAQRDYVRWKYEAFGDLASEWHENGRVGFSTKHLPVFARMRAWFYARYSGSARTPRYKHIGTHVFHKLTPLSLAVWYQDDGDLSAGRRRNTITMHSTSPEERAALVRAFQQRFGLTPIIAEYSATTRISFTGDEAERFEALIAPYVHPSMAYKLRSKEGVGDCLPALEFGHRIEATAIPCEVYEITRQIRRGKQAVRYNLQVEDNATYIVGDTIVHNSPETQPGGRALKFYASVRLDIRRVEGIKVGGDTVGNRTRVRVTKNKVAAPFRECEFDIMFYESGISKLGEVIDLGVELGMIEKRGAFFRYNDGLLGQGRENAKVFLMENKAVADEIEDAIRAHFGLPAPSLPPAQ